jgi:hypothetical protein
MAPKEKAKELFDKFYLIPELNGSCILTKHTAKQCALIVVDEILNEFPKGFNGNFEMKRKLYWQEVKQEINKL